MGELVKLPYNVESSEAIVYAANVVAYLVRAYPEKTITEVIQQLVHMPDMLINAGIWCARDRGWISEVDGETGHSTYIGGDDHIWKFSPELTQFCDILLYCVGQQNQRESDIEEHDLAGWSGGFPAHDVLVGTKWLLERKLLHEYAVESVDKKGQGSTYIFYTLYKNRDKLWGEKKLNPESIKRKENK